MIVVFVLWNELRAVRFWLDEYFGGFDRRALLFYSPYYFDPMWGGAFSLDVETGYVFTSLNDSRSPNTTGSLVSLTRDLEDAPRSFLPPSMGRSPRATPRFARVVRAIGDPRPRNLDPRREYEGTLFPAGTPVFAYYRFDSYRLTYRYSFVRRAGLEMMGGSREDPRRGNVPQWGRSRGQDQHGIRAALPPLPRLEAEAGKTGCSSTWTPRRRNKAAPRIFWWPSPTLPARGRMARGVSHVGGRADVEEVYSFAWLHTRWLDEGGSLIRPDPFGGSAFG
jgi:hypothetical protein